MLSSYRVVGIVYKWLIYIATIVAILTHQQVNHLKGPRCLKHQLVMIQGSTTNRPSRLKNFLFLSLNGMVASLIEPPRSMSSSILREWRTPLVEWCTPFAKWGSR